MFNKRAHKLFETNVFSGQILLEHKKKMENCAIRSKVDRNVLKIEL